MKSICVVTQQYTKTISGIGLHARLLVQKLVEDGFGVTVIAPQSQIPKSDKSCRFIGVKDPFWGNSQARWLPLSLSYSQVLYQIENSIDLVHFTDAREAFLVKYKNFALVGNVNDTYAIDFSKISYCYKTYHDWLARWSYYFILRYFEKKTYPCYDVIIANSRYTANTIANAYKLNRNQILVCYKAIDINLLQPILMARQKNQDESHTRILFIGGNMQRKGLPTLIRAASIVLENFPDAEFWIVGQDRCLPKIKKLCVQYKVLHAFKFFGWKSRDELLNMYSNVDVFVMPSLAEAFGMVYLEAMASGVPVIGTSVGGVPELIIDGYNGALVEPMNHKQLANMIIEVLKNKKLRMDLVEKGLETARNFNVDRMIACTYSIYNSIFG